MVLRANNPSRQGSSRDVTIGRLRAVYAKPPGDGPFAGVIVVHDALGLGQDMRGMVDQFTRAGYAAVAPDLYSDGARPLCVARTLVDTVRSSGGQTADRIGAVRSWLADQPEVDEHRLGVIGYCMGGGFALAAAVRLDFSVAAVNYGVVPAETSQLAGVCPVVASYGDRDRMFAPNAARLQTHLQRLGVSHDIKVYPNVGHGFLSPTPPPRWTAPASPLLHVGYDEPAAGDAWQRIFSFFHERLAREANKGS